MTTIHPEYVVDENHQPKAVLIALGEWEQIVEELEELDDIRAYDLAKQEPQEHEFFEESLDELRRKRTAVSGGDSLWSTGVSE